MDNKSNLIFLPEQQVRASTELNKAIAIAMQKVLDDQQVRPNITLLERMTELKTVIGEEIRTWMQKYPVLNNLNISFELSFNPLTQKVVMNPSFDLQRLMGGLIGGI